MCCQGQVTVVMARPGCMYLSCYRMQDREMSVGRKRLISCRYWETEVKVLFVLSSVDKSCPALCDPVDCSLPGSSIQARILEWVAISSPGDLPTTETEPALAGGFFITEPPGEAPLFVYRAAKIAKRSRLKREAKKKTALTFWYNPTMDDPLVPLPGGTGYHGRRWSTLLPNISSEEDSLLRITKRSKTQCKVLDTHLVDTESLGFVKPCGPFKQH